MTFKIFVFDVFRQCVEKLDQLCKHFNRKCALLLLLLLASLHVVGTADWIYAMPERLINGRRTDEGQIILLLSTLWQEKQTLLAFQDSHSKCLHVYKKKKKKKGVENKTNCVFSISGSGWTDIHFFPFGFTCNVVK